MDTPYTASDDEIQAKDTGRELTRRRRPRVLEPGKEQASRLSGLATELIIEVAEHLPVSSQLVLSLACKRLRDIIGRHVLHSRRFAGSKLKAVAQYEYLACLARDPAYWLCGPCVTLHRTTERALLGLADTCTKNHQPSPPSIIPGPVFLTYEHVQLALKLNRLSRERRRYRDATAKILAPAVGSGRFTQPSGIHVRFSNRFKVVDGRFLSYSEQRLSETECGGPHRRTIEQNSHIWVCAHESYHGICCHGSIEHPSGYRRLVRNSSNHSLRTSKLIDAVDLALMNPGSGAAHGSCPKCPTDFQVRALPGMLIVCAWRDLGPKGSPQNSEWNNLLGLEPPEYTMRHQHVPGSVRARFGRVDGVHWPSRPNGLTRESDIALCP